MFHKHALGMVVVGICSHCEHMPSSRVPPLLMCCYSVRCVAMLCAAPAEPIATHSPPVPFRCVCCCTQEPRRAQRRAGVVVCTSAGYRMYPQNYTQCNFEDMTGFCSSCRLRKVHGWTFCTKKSVAGSARERPYYSLDLIYLFYYTICDMDDAARYAPFSAQEREALAASGIEAAHTEEALRYFAEQRARGERGDGAHTFDMPEIDNEQVIDTRDDVPLRMPYRQCVVALAKYIPYAQLQSLLPAVERRTSEGVVQWNNALLAEVGRALYHTCAYGMFNGGSATSYTDAIHNQNLNAQLFEQWRERIDNSARAYGQLPKGLCPALYNRDGEGAWSFMELHIRHLVRESARCGRAIPLFQMTSPSSDAHIRDATREIYARYLPAEEACDHYALSGDMLCAVQPLLATFAYDARAGSLFDAGRQQQQDAGRQQQDAGRQQQQDAGWQQQDAGRQSQQDAGRQSQQDEGWQSQQDAGRRQQQDAGWQPRDTGGAGVPNGAEVKNGAGIGGGAGVPNGAEVKDSAGIGDGRSVANGVSVESGTGVLNGADIDGGTDIKSRASMAAEKATTAPADSEKAGVNGGAGIGSGTDVENGAEVKNGAGVGGGTGVPNGAEVKDSAGVPRSTPPLFMDPRAEKRRAYGLPGGHGQCFGVLRTLLEALFARGVRFVWLGNVDNVGYTMNPIALAYLVLRGGEALFEAVPRSTVDRKGGVLVRDGDGQGALHGAWRRGAAGAGIGCRAGGQDHAF